MSPKDFTPVQRKMLAVLSDGRPHKKTELHRCLYDELGESDNVFFHLSRMRKHLRPAGQDIICELYRGALYYRHIRLLAPASAG